jgi:glutamate---cysteine ligase / carboxylate-amine ligase
VSGDRFTFGIEEEYLVVDAESRDLRPRAERILETAHEQVGDEVAAELSESQVEVGTPICATLADARRNLTRLRAAAMAAAEAHGSRITAMASHPFADWLGQGITHKERYEAMGEAYQQLAREQLICGCHVHVAVDDPDLAVRVMDRSRPWLPAFLALSANSPFWQGVDTGYASFRTLTFDRWPTTGSPPVLGSRAAYDELVAALVRVGAIDDPRSLYWDIRPSMRYQTLELRTLDVCLGLDDAVALAGLARSLVRTLHGEEVAGAAPVEARPELVRVARWRAARYGLGGHLIDAAAGEEVPARVLVDRLLGRCRPDLEDSGEWDEVSAGVREVLARGNGADRQRAVFEQHGSFTEVVDFVVARSRPEPAEGGRATPR